MSVVEEVRALAKDVAVFVHDELAAAFGKRPKAIDRKATGVTFLVPVRAVHPIRGFFIEARLEVNVVANSTPAARSRKRWGHRPEIEVRLAWDIRGFDRKSQMRYRLPFDPSLEENIHNAIRDFKMDIERV